jgi:hypothetical protein
MFRSMFLSTRHPFTAVFLGPALMYTMRDT